MSATQEQIDKLYTLTQQNKDLIAYVNSLIPAAEQALLTEIATGKQELVNAIRFWGIDCSMDDSLATLADKMSRLVIAVKNNVVLKDTTPKPYTSGYILNNCDTEVLEIHDYDTKKVSNTNLKSLKVLDCPNATSVSRIYSAALEVANILNCETFGNYLFTDTKVLIDLTIGKNFVGNKNFSSIYNPTTAMSKTSKSLVADGELFTTNNEKWNYNLREHFAANLPDRTSMEALTITFGATVLGNMEEATIAAFNNKNWTLA